MIRTALGRALSALILPAQFQPFNRALSKEIEDQVARTKQNPFLTVKEGYVGSTRDARIHYYEISRPSKEVEKSQKVLIHLGGNAAVSEFYMNEFRTFAYDYPGVKIVGFNVRNVQKSKGVVSCEQDLVDDAKSVIKHFINQGIARENIYLVGESLGAAVLTMAAGQLYKEEQRRAKQDKSEPKSINVFNARSFSSLTNMVLHSVFGGVGCGLFLGLMLGAPYAFLVAATPVLKATIALGVLGAIVPKLTKALTRPFVKAILYPFGEMNAHREYARLPKGSKDYIMVKDDNVIGAQSGLHAALKEKRSKAKAALRAEMQRLKDQEQAGNRPPEYFSTLQKLESELKNIKTSKLHYLGQEDTDVNRHCENLHFLHSQYRDRRSNLSVVPALLTGHEVRAEKLERLGLVRV